MQTKINFILLIDDNVADNKLHETIISRLNFSSQTKSITHPLEALTYFKNCFAEYPSIHYPVPDLVFLDLFMPTYNGFELLDQLKKLPDPYQRKAKMKFVLLTEELSAENMQRIQADYSDVIFASTSKPLHNAKLSDISKSICEME